MAVVQNDFSQYGEIGFHGQINTDYPRKVSTQHAEGSSIGFGLGVSYGTADKQALLGGAAADLIGVTVRTQAVENDSDGVPVYRENQAMSVMESGRMFLKVSDGSERGKPVYVVEATGELVSTASDNVLLAGAKFVRTAAAEAITEIEIK